MLVYGQEIVETVPVLRDEKKEEKKQEERKRKKKSSVLIPTILVLLNFVLA